MKIKISEIILPAAGLAFALLVLCMQPVSGEVVVSAIVQQNLEQAFKRAFNDPAEFRDSGVFQLLGYTSSEIEQIGKITPRPASITVEADYIEQENVYKNIRVICEKVLYYNLTIDRVTFEFPDCRLSSEDLAEGRLRFISSKQIKLKTEVSADDIARVFDLVARARRLRNLRIELEQDRAKVNGRVRRGLFTVDRRIITSDLPSWLMLKQSCSVANACGSIVSLCRAMLSTLCFEVSIQFSMPEKPG
jgi:hypothetical protein